MTWVEQAEGLMQAWTETQKTMWKGWYEMAQIASNPMMTDPDILEQWQSMLSQSRDMWTSGATSIPQNVSQQFIASQAAMMRVLELTTKAWNAMAPKLDSGEDWQKVLKSYSEQFRQQLSPREFNEALYDTKNLWQLYLQQMKQFSQPWTDMMQRVPPHMSTMAAGNTGAGAIELTKLYANAYDQTFGKLLLSPSVGFTRELEEKIAKAFDAWKDAQRAGNDYQLLMAEAWSGVFEQVMTTLVKRAEQGKPVQSMRELMRVWTDSADNSFKNVFSSEAYSDTQGRFVNATMTYRIREQVVMDEIMKSLNLPSRGEVDEAHRNIYELRKEVKALKKALKQQSQAAPAPAPAPAPAAPAKSSAKQSQSSPQG